MSPVIRISQSIYERLKALAEPFTDTPASVIERLLDLHEHQSKAKKTSFETSKIASENLENLPDTLDQVLKVCSLVWDKGKTYQEAVNIVAQAVNVEPNTVRDKCTRLISIKGVVKINAALFLQLLQDKKRMADHLMCKFSRHEKVIEKQILGIDDESDGSFEENDGDDMTHLWEIWEVMEKHMPPGKTFTLEEIYDIVERHCNLKPGDYAPQAPDSSIPKWKRNVRNVLQKKKEEGKIIWSGRGEYRRI